MANYNNLKAGIDAVIKTNGRQEISGAALNTQLKNMITELGAGYQYMGVATPATNPGTPDANVFYLASEAGTYTNFGGIVINEGEVCALVWNGTWAKQVTGAATADKLNQLGQKIGPIGVNDYSLTAGANNVLNIGDVKTGDKITINARLGFTPTQNWYLSLFSNGQQIGSAKTVVMPETETIWDVEFNQEYDDVILVVSIWGTVGNVSVSVNFANNISEQIDTIKGVIYDNITKQKEFVMSSGANPTISFVVHEGETCVISVSGMSGTQYAEGGVNDENQQTFQTFTLNAANNWEKEIVLVGDASLFWLVCRNTTGQNGVFSVINKESAIVIERNRAIAAESLNAEHIENNSDSINSIKELLKEKEQVSGYPIVYGRNDIFNLGDVGIGQIIELIGTIDFVPSEDWYLSIQTQQGEMVSYRFAPSQNGFSKTIVFADNRTDVKVAVSVYGSVFGNINSTCSFGDSYEYIKKVVEGLDKFVYNVIRGCLGSGKTNDEYYSIDGTAGFDSAMSVMRANLGGKIIVPSGQYRVSSPIVLNTHCVNIEGSIWNYPNHPNGVYESNNGTKIKIESQNIVALIIRTGSANGFRISQIGFAGTIPNGATKGIFDKSNPFVNCGILMESYHDQYEIRRISCEGLAVGFAGNGAGMDAGIIECFNADGCNIGIYCENITPASTCYYFKICHNVLSDCPAFGIYMNGKVDDTYKYLGAEIFGNTLVRNGGGFTDEQIADFGGDSECAAVYIKGIHKGSFHDNIIQDAGVFNNVSGGTPVTEYQTRKSCILDTKSSLIIGNQFLGDGTSIDLYGDDNNIANNISTNDLIINGANNNVTGNKIYRIIINGSGNLVQGNRCSSQLITINGDNNIVIAPTSYTITDNGTGNIIVRL